jgi:hypothetical protein
MAFVALNAAHVAYRKVRKQTRKALMSSKDATYPEFLSFIAIHLPEEEGKRKAGSEIKITLTERERHERSFKRLQDHWYVILQWQVYSKITSQQWFENIILLNICAVGVSTGIELEYGGSEIPSDTATALRAVNTTSLAVFTMECVLKLIAEGYNPARYFTDEKNGYFNCFDFIIVVLSYCFMGSDGSAIGALRMLRLVRVLTFIKGVTELRIILGGLVFGMQSVGHIVLVMLLMIYMFSILGCLLFGDNDPARFGTVPQASKFFAPATYIPSNEGVSLTYALKKSKFTLIIMK